MQRCTGIICILYCTRVRIALNRYIPILHPATEETRLHYTTIIIIITFYTPHIVFINHLGGDKTERDQETSYRFSYLLFSFSPATPTLLDSLYGDGFFPSSQFRLVVTTCRSRHVLPDQTARYGFTRTVQCIRIYVMLLWKIIRKIFVDNIINAQCIYMYITTAQLKPLGEYTNNTAPVVAWLRAERISTAVLSPLCTTHHFVPSYTRPTMPSYRDLGKIGVQKKYL